MPESRQPSSCAAFNARIVLRKSFYAAATASIQRQTSSNWVGLMTEKAFSAMAVTLVLSVFYHEHSELRIACALPTEITAEGFGCLISSRYHKPKEIDRD
jgi:hypothetical protein